MSLHGDYDPDNIFAKILRGEAPAVVVEETGETLSFMDVFPQSRGHMLVVPKTRARNLLEIDPDALPAVIAQVQRIARAAEAAFKPDGINIAQFNGEEAGQSVFHIHFHVIPRFSGQSLGRHGGDMADTDELKALADQVRAELK